MKSAFRNLPIRKSDWKYLVMRCLNPMTNKYQYFIDKCLPFGASISCSHFQRVSNAISHIVQFKAEANLVEKSSLGELGSPRVNSPLGLNINYLDDFLFPAVKESLCNQFIQVFIQVCDIIQFPLSMEKTEWAAQLIIFLGMLIDLVNRQVSIPLEKIEKALDQLRQITLAKKVTARQIQSLAGLLNFLCRAVVPGRAFTRRLYNSIKGLSQYHHLRVTPAIRDDCAM